MNKNRFLIAFFVSFVVIGMTMMSVTGLFLRKPFPSVPVILPNSNTVKYVKPRFHRFIEFGFPIFLKRLDTPLTVGPWQFLVTPFLLNILWIGLLSGGISYLITHPKNMKPASN